MEYRKCHYVVIYCERHDCYVKISETQNKVIQARLHATVYRIADSGIVFVFGRLTRFCSRCHAIANRPFRHSTYLAFIHFANASNVATQYYQRNCNKSISERAVVRSKIANFPCQLEYVRTNGVHTLLYGASEKQRAHILFGIQPRWRKQLNERRRHGSEEAIVFTTDHIFVYGICVWTGVWSCCSTQKTTTALRHTTTLADANKVYDGTRLPHITTHNLMGK